MNEAQLKRAIVKDMQFYGIYARRIEHQYSSGIPDLLVKHLNLPAMLIEVKYFKAETRSPTIPNKATPLQRDELARWQIANGLSYIWSIYGTATAGMYFLYSSSDVEADNFQKIGTPCYTKERGKNWSLGSFLFDISGKRV
jgi:hypothetical protein